MKHSTNNSTSKKVFYLLTALLIVIVLGVILTPKRTENTSNSVATNEALLSSEGAVVNGVRKFKWVLKEGKLVQGAYDLKVKQGEDVEITITALDESGESYVNLEGYLANTEVLHSHGFGLLAFKADKTGKFKVEAEVESEEHEEQESSSSEEAGHEENDEVVLGTIEVEAN